MGTNEFLKQQMIKDAKEQGYMPNDSNEVFKKAMLSLMEIQSELDPENVMTREHLTLLKLHVEDLSKSINRKIGDSVFVRKTA